MCIRDSVSPDIAAMGGKPVLREKADRSGPYITDNGNFILDVDFGAIDNPSLLESRLKAFPGVVETGLFIGMAHLAYVGTEKTVRTIRRE